MSRQRNKVKNKQQKIQLFLISTGLLLIFLTYFYNPEIKKDLSVENNITKESDNTYIAGDKSGTKFEEVQYQGIYDLDKSFTVKSEKAYILDDKPNLVYMTNMHVVLYLTDGRVVNILSNKGKYNKVTYDCFFQENVRAEDGETKIFASNLDLLATKNTAEIYNNVILELPTASLVADKIDYDFDSKNFKVSMFDDKAVKMKVIK